MDGRSWRLLIFMMISVLASCSPVGFSANTESAKLCGGTDCPATETNTSYIWNEGPWNLCSKPCGGGTQTRAVVCQTTTGVAALDTSCSGVKPIQSQTCNNDVCSNPGGTTYGWLISDWSDCNVTCGGGQRSRVVVCADQTGAYQADNKCTTAKPTTVEACNTQSCPTTNLYTWRVGDWGACSKTCEGGTQTRSVVCEATDHSVVLDSQCTTAKPVNSRACNTQTCAHSYTWVTGGWGGCSVTCGGGTQSRSVACQRDDGVFVDGSLCGAGAPGATQACNTQVCPQPTTRSVTESKYVTPAQSQVDILLVLDDSFSMSYDNPKLGQRLGGFVSELAASGIDWRMCVTTTDTAYYAGRPLVWSGTNSVVLTAAQPNLSQVFNQTASDVTSFREGSSDERGIAAMNMSLQNNAQYGCFRQGAALSVILISDENERSVGGDQAQSYVQYVPLANEDLPQTFINSVASYFGAQKRLTVNSIVVKDSACEAMQDAQGSPSFWGTLYMQLSNATGGYIGSICDNDYYTNLHYFKERIQNSLETFQLQCQPVGSVQVSVNPPVPSLSYSMQGTVIRFNPVLPEGRTVTLSYACPL